MRKVETRQKVTAFILRSTPAGSRQILLHAFATAPELPLRLPGGGVDPGETPLQALWRDLAEETGLTTLRLERRLGVQAYYKPFIGAHVARHDFLLWAAEGTLDTWEHSVTGAGADAGDRFRLLWRDPGSLHGIDDEHRPFIIPAYVPELFATAAG